MATMQERRTFEDEYRAARRRARQDRAIPVGVALAALTVIALVATFL